MVRLLSWSNMHQGCPPPHIFEEMILCLEKFLSSLHWLLGITISHHSPMGAEALSFAGLVRIRR